MLYAIIMGIIALFIAIFALQNAAAVEVSFLVWHFSLSLALIILAVCCWASCWPACGP